MPGRTGDMKREDKKREDKKREDKKREVKMETRIERMRNNIDDLNNAGLYRSAAYKIVGSSLRETEDQPIQLRRAKAIADLLDKSEQSVFPDEPIVGSMIGLWTLDTDLPNYQIQKNAAVEAVEAYLASKNDDKEKTKKNENKLKPLEEEVSESRARWALMSRVHHDASLTYSDYQKMLSDMELHFSNTDIQRYEIGKVLEATLRIQYDSEDREIMNKLPWLPGNHLGLDYEAVLTQGMGKMRDDINKYRTATNDPESIEFYTATDTVINSMINYFSRYAEKVREIVESGAGFASVTGSVPETGSVKTSEERKNELLQMADILEKMSVSPAQTFREALQTVWLLHVMSCIVGGSAMSFSRFDQYMLPFYEHDINKGISRDELGELLGCFWLKINEPKLRTVQSMTVGGIKPDGSDAYNDLTLLCLETARDIKVPYPNIAVRVSANTRDYIYDAIMDTIKAGCGQPMLLNDDVFVENFKKLGYSDDLANDYFNMGCVELMIQGKQPLWGGGGSVTYTECLQKTLDAYINGEFSGESFDDFMEYFLENIRAVTDQCHEKSLAVKQSMETCYDPFCSILTQDCIKRGRDMHHGGSVCPAHWSIYAHGLGTLADSLAAIKKFVYEEKKISLDDLITALDADFTDHESIYLILDRNTPCFGNDIDETDEIADKVFFELTKKIFELNNPGEEDKYVSTFFSYFSHVLSGEVTKATPNGRRAGQSLSDSMAPTQGKDVNGPTKMLNSILKIDPSYVTGGYALNLKVNPTLTKTDQGTAALKGLLKAYILGKGPQIQVNFIDAEALKEAQIDPDKHRNIVVRVGGYCEYFTNLDKTLQNEIIERTEHGL